MGSRRLPAKSLADVNGRSLLGHCIWRLEATGLPVMVATTDQPEDDAIAAEAELAGAGTYRGAADDVLARYVGAADACGASYVIRATADNPAVDGDSADRALEILRRTRADHVIECGLPIGAAIEATTTDALVRAAQLATDPQDREHVTPFIRRDRRFTAIRVMAAPAIRRPDLRLTVDTLEDLEFMRAVLRPFAGRVRPASLVEIVGVAERLWPEHHANLLKEVGA
jgi:spore coat polysaccharide biosynthesis protein SpsF (cytidylyltransferase family)